MPLYMHDDGLSYRICHYVPPSCSRVNSELVRHRVNSKQRTSIQIKKSIEKVYQYIKTLEILYCYRTKSFGTIDDFIQLNLVFGLMDLGP